MNLRHKLEVFVAVIVTVLASGLITLILFKTNSQCLKAVVTPSVAVAQNFSFITDQMCPGGNLVTGMDLSPITAALACAADIRCSGVRTEEDGSVSIISGCHADDLQPSDSPKQSTYIIDDDVAAFSVEVV